jgi:hypothetical protein
MSTLVFLAIFNLAGFTVLPYLSSKTPLVFGFMPLAFLHKIFILAQLILIGAAFPIFSNQYVEFAYFFAVIAFVNMVFDFRYIASKVFSLEIPKFYLGSISYDFGQLKNYAFKKSGKFDMDVVFVENNRIVTDIAIFGLNSLIILFYFI